MSKPQIAVEAAFQVRDEQLDGSVFWVLAVDANSFENAYHKIAWQLKIEGQGKDKADAKLLVKTALNQESAGR